MKCLRSFLIVGLFLTGGAVLSHGDTRADRAGNSGGSTTVSTIPVSYTIMNNSDVTTAVWHGITEGTVNNQYAQPILQPGQSASGSFVLPLASIYSAFAQAQMIVTAPTYAQCSYDFTNTNGTGLTGLVSQVVIYGSSTIGYACVIQVSASGNSPLPPRAPR